MSKLVVLNLGKGTLQDGFPHVSVQLQDEKTSSWKQFQGSLPAAPNIIDLYRRWQLLYDLIYEARSINIGLRNSQFVDEDIIIDNADVTHVSDAEFYQVCEELQNKIIIDEQLSFWTDFRWSSQEVKEKFEWLIQNNKDLRENRLEPECAEAKLFAILEKAVWTQFGLIAIAD